jgi:hypothetical protein
MAVAAVPPNGDPTGGRLVVFDAETTTRCGTDSSFATVLKNGEVECCVKLKRQPSLLSTSLGSVSRVCV